MEDLREVGEVLGRLKAGQVAVLGDELCRTAAQSLDLMLARYPSPLLQLVLSQAKSLHTRLGQFSLTVLRLVLSWLCVSDHRHFICRVEAAEKCFAAAISCLQACAEPLDVSNVQLLRQILTSAQEIHMPGSRFPSMEQAVLQAYLSSIPSQSGDFTCLGTRVSVQTVQCPGMEACTVLQGVLVPYSGEVAEKKEAVACVYESVWQN